MLRMTFWFWNVMGNVMSIVQQKKSTRFLKNSAPQKKISAPR